MTHDRSKFARGSGCYVCRSCGHRTRNTGGGGAGIRLCDLCTSISETENMISDCGDPCGTLAREVAALVAERDARNAKADRPVVKDCPICGGEGWTEGSVEIRRHNPDRTTRCVGCEGSGRIKSRTTS